MAEDVTVETTTSEVAVTSAVMAQPASGETPIVDEQFDIEQLRAALKKANAEAAERRHKLTQYEEAERKRAEAELSETEKANKRVTDAQARAEQLEKRLRDVTLRHAVEMTAAALRFYDPADAVALADLSSAEIGENGTVTGVEQALKALAKAKPHLVRSEQPANLNTQARSSGAGSVTDADAERLAAIYGVRPDSIKQAMRS